MAIHTTTDTAIRSAKPTDKQYRISDGGGLYLLVKPTGAKWWRFDYTFAGKRNTLSMGVYPAVSLKSAREKAAEARELIANGINPSEKRQAESRTEDNKQGEFEKIALEYLSDNQHNWSDRYYKLIKRLVEDVWISEFGQRSFSEIRTKEIVAVIRRLKNEGYGETVHKALTSLSGIYNLAVVLELAEVNPCPTITKLKILPMRKLTSFAAVTKPDDLADVWRKLNESTANPKAIFALKIMAWTFPRPYNVRTMEVDELDFETELWIIPSAKMKRSKQEKLTGEDHIVPLPKQAIPTLKTLVEVAKMNRTSYVFGSLYGGRYIPISEPTLYKAMSQSGIPSSAQTVHGFRATARTILDEVLEYRPYWIEAQLGHVVSDMNGTSYNRAKHIKNRSEMIQAWADYLDDLQNSNTLK